MEDSDIVSMPWTETVEAVQHTPLSLLSSSVLSSPSSISISISTFVSISVFVKLASTSAWTQKAKLQLVEDTLLEAVASEAVSKIEAFAAQNLANASWAFATF